MYHKYRDSNRWLYYSIYFFWQRSLDRKSIITSLVHQIGDIEDVVQSYLEARSENENCELFNQEIYANKDFYTKNQWEDNKTVFVRFLNLQEYKEMQRFFDLITKMQNERRTILESYESNLQDKNSALQEAFADILKKTEHKRLGMDIEKRRKVSNDITRGIWTDLSLTDHLFQSRVPREELNKDLNEYIKISTSGAYKKILKKAGRKTRKFYSIKYHNVKS